MTGSNQEQRPVRRRRSFTAEFKADAVALVLVEGRTIVDVARSSASALARWGTGFVRTGSTVATPSG